MTYTWNLKYDTNELIQETETDSQTQRTDLNGMGIPALLKLSLEETDWAGGRQWDTSFVKVQIEERTDTYMK